ncbi:hypothetical protein V8B97DRAFT_1368183 [Scleroderma yunnanense]
MTPGVVDEYKRVHSNTRSCHRLHPCAFEPPQAILYPHAHETFPGKFTLTPPLRPSDHPRYYIPSPGCILGARMWRRSSDQHLFNHPWLDTWSHTRTLYHPKVLKEYILRWTMTE